VHNSRLLRPLCTIGKRKILNFNLCLRKIVEGVFQFKEKCLHQDIFNSKILDLWWTSYIHLKVEPNFVGASEIIGLVVFLCEQDEFGSCSH